MGCQQNAFRKQILMCNLGIKKWKDIYSPVSVTISNALNSTGGYSDESTRYVGVINAPVHSIVNHPLVLPSAIMVLTIQRQLQNKAGAELP